MSEDIKTTATITYGDQEVTGLNLGETATLKTANLMLTNDLKVKLFGINGIWVGESDGSLEFNHAENIAYSEKSNAFGFKTKAGGKGFKITSCSGTKGGTGTYTLSSTNGLEVGMNYNVRLSDVFYNDGVINTGKITAISGNVITVDNYPAITLDGGADSEFAKEDYLTITGRPDLGDTEVGFFSLVVGENSTAQDRSAVAFGREAKAIGQYAFAEGRQTVAGYAAHAEGYKTTALANGSHAEGQETQATKSQAHAEGKYTKATAQAAHAEGVHSQAINTAAHAEGNNTRAEGEYSHSEGRDTKAYGKDSHAEGLGTEAHGQASHAEGYLTKAIGNYAHAEGWYTRALADRSHAEGYNTEASGYAAHAEGSGSKATNDHTHAEGNTTEANGQYSHSEGWGTISNGVAQHVQGKFNEKDTSNQYAHIVGGGTNFENRKNIHTLDWKGNAHFAGRLSFVEGIGYGTEEQLNELTANAEEGDLKDGQIFFIIE